MKRILALILLSVFLFSLAACSDPATDSSASGSDLASDSATDPVSQDPSSDKESESTPSPYPETKGKLIALTDQRNKEIVVLSMDAPDLRANSAAVWRWSVNSKGDLEYASSAGRGLDDVRIRDCEAWGGKVVGVTSSSGLVALIDYKTKKCLFNASMGKLGPHSIEILPNGLIAVAASGNSTPKNGVLRLYSALSKTDSKYVEIPIYSAHGVLWDPELECLWVLGGDRLTSYTVGGTREAPTLTKREGVGVSTNGGHDLSPVYGNTDLLWVTYYNKVSQYSKSQNKLLNDYQAQPAISTGGVKSINTFSDGVTLMTVADPKNATADHNTNVLRIFRYKEVSGTWRYIMDSVVFDGSVGKARDFYKVRAFLTDYQ